MRAAVDSSVLLDVLLGDPLHELASLRLLEEHSARGSLVLCPIAYAECAAAFTPASEFAKVAQGMGLVYDDFDQETAALAGQMWQDYRRRGGSRQRIIPDFMIAAHAQVRAEVLLSRDRGYFRDYFQGLRVIAP